MDEGEGEEEEEGQMGEEEEEPSSLKEKEVNVQFPFMVTRVDAAKADMVDKFSPKMDKSCVKAFAVFGPLRCLHAAFSSFLATHKETKYRGMFQQIFPCFTQMSGLRTRIHDLSAQSAAEPPSITGMLPLDDRASSDSAALYRFDPESSEGQGRADYVLRTITKKKLEEFKAGHEEIDWKSLDQEELARKVFAAVPDADVRCDAILDVKTDSVSKWLVKTRDQLTAYGNQAALQNLKKGFPPRPIYLIAIDPTRWLLCILDPMGLVTVTGHSVTGFVEFDAQQTLRASWIKKKDPSLEGYFATIKPRTALTLQARLDKVNNLLRQEENTSGVAAGKYVVSNLWDGNDVHFWNGYGLQGQFQQGTLTLCEGLLRLVCGDKVCNAGWTAQRLRMVFGRQYEMDIDRCLKFESEVRATLPRSIDCTYSPELQSAAVREIKSIRLKPSAAFDNGFMDSIVKARDFLKRIVRVPATSSDLLKVGCLYGGREFLQLLDDETKSKIGTLVHHIVVDSDTAAEDDSVQCFTAMVIGAANLPKMPILKECKVLVCYDMAMLRYLWHDLFVRSYDRLVVFYKKVDAKALSMLNKLKAEVMEVVMLGDEATLDALAAYLGIKVIVTFESNGDLVLDDLANFLGDAKTIVSCGEELIVYLPEGMETSHPLRGVLELRLSGATYDHLNERMKCVLAAVTAVNSALKEGVVPGKGIGLLAAVEELPGPLESSDADYNAGVRIVETTLKAIEGVSKSSSKVAQIKANLFKLQSPEEFSIMLEDGEIDLRKSAEATLDMLVDLYSHAVFVANKRQRPSSVPEHEN